MNMIRKLKLKGKLSALMLLIGIIPVIVAAIGINWVVRDRVKANVTEQFDAMAAIKQQQIEEYFSRIRNQMLTLAEDKMIVDAMHEFAHAFRSLPTESGMQRPETAAEYRRKVEAYYTNTFKSAYSEKNKNSAVDASVLVPESDAAIAAQYLYIANNKYPLGEKNKLIDANDSSSYTSVHKKYHPVINNFLEKFGYYDMFLIDADSGSVVYSVFKEADFASNVLSGYLQNTNFSKLAKEAKSLPAGSAKLVDFAEYFPSYNLPAAFFVAPIYDGNQLIGILASQLPMGEINSLMQSTTGMRESGETYLAGSDLLMRSQSRFSKENTVFKTKVATPAVQAALEGKSGAMLNQDYRGIDVISAYRPLKIEGLNWVVIAKIDQAEAFDMLASITNMTFIGLALVSVIILLVGRLVSGRVANPIIVAAQVADNIAAGKLDTQINADGNDEISELLKSLDTMQSNLKQQIENSRKVTAEIQAQQDAIGKSMATIEFNMDGTIIGANELFLKAMGYSLSEIQGRHHSMFAEPGAANSVEYRQFWEKLNRGEFDAGEYKRLGKSGREVWLQATYNPILDINGKPVKVIKFATDITEAKLKNADVSGQIAAIEKSQAVIHFNMDGTIITANDLFCKLMGYTLAEIQGRHHSMFAAAGVADTGEYRQFWGKLNRGEFDAGEYKRLGKNGREVWLQATYNPILDLNGKPFKVTKFAADVTEAKVKNADFSGQIDAIDKSQAVIQFNMDGTIITANDLFCKLMGYSLAEIQGRHHSMFAEAGVAETAGYHQFWEKLNRGEFDIGEYKRLGKGGRAVYLQASYNPIFDLNGKPFKVVKYASDITAQTLTNQTLAQIFSEVGTVMGNVAEGDLTLKITGDYEGIYLQCKNAINDSIDKLSEIVGNVSSSAVFINNSSQEIASGNNNLSQRAEQQAANLEETAASMEELTSTVKNNADNAQQANMVASNAGELAEKGGNVVRAAISAMQEINESSNKIADIIGVIDEIAFQTNLLALNASVEAARAGEQGRGFSVVATEVRNLAQRSATAARESKDLIQNSVQKVRAGTEFVNETGKALSEIVTSVKKVGEIVAGIANASIEQSAGIAQVNQAVSQMDEITQQNAALAEEASAASVSMSDLSSNMVELLAFFKLSQSASSSRASHNDSQAAPRRGENPKSTASHRPAKSATHNKQANYDSTSDDEWQDF